MYFKLEIYNFQNEFKVLKSVNNHKNWMGIQDNMYSMNMKTNRRIRDIYEHIQLLKTKREALLITLVRCFIVVLRRQWYEKLQ